MYMIPNSASKNVVARNFPECKHPLEDLWGLCLDPKDPLEKLKTQVNFEKFELNSVIEHIDDLVKEIELKKFWEAKHERNTNYYIDCERKIVQLKEEVKNLV